MYAGYHPTQVIVVVDCLDRQPVGLKIPQRVSRALGEAGPATLLTSLTNLVTFAVAASVDFPSVRRCARVWAIVTHPPCPRPHP